MKRVCWISVSRRLERSQSTNPAQWTLLSTVLSINCRRNKTEQLIFSILLPARNTSAWNSFCPDYHCPDYFEHLSIIGKLWASIPCISSNRSRYKILLSRSNQSFLENIPQDVSLLRETATLWILVRSTSVLLLLLSKSPSWLTNQGKLHSKWNSYLLG